MEPIKDRVQLFNLEADPAETRNLASAEPERARALRQTLHDWRAHVGARLPVANPQHDPARAGELGKPGRGR